MLLAVEMQKYVRVFQEQKLIYLFFLKKKKKEVKSVSIPVRAWEADKLAWFLSKISFQNIWWLMELKVSAVAATM